MKPLNKIKIKWSSKLAYAIGLIATDGCLYNDGRHLAFVSRDLSLIQIFKKCLGIKVKIARKQSGFKKGSFSFWVQFGDVGFYNFLISIGLTPKKSKSLGTLKIPDKYFFHFLRGSFDGDGTFYSYWDKRWASSFMFYLVFISASKKHLFWIRDKCLRLVDVFGHMNNNLASKTFQLRYAKHEAIKIFRKIYSKSFKCRLERKYKKVYNALAVNKSHS